MRPKRAEDLFVEQVDAEYLVYHTDSDSAAALNAAAAAVFNLCDGEHDVDGMVAALAKTPQPLDRDAVLLALDELSEAELIDGSPEGEGMSRRDLLMKLGVGTAAAAAIPVVELIAAPSMAAAQSPSPSPPSPSPPSPSPTPSPPTPSPTPSPPTPSPTPSPPTPSPTPSPPTPSPTPTPTED